MIYEYLPVSDYQLGLDGRHQRLSVIEHVQNKCLDTRRYYERKSLNEAEHDSITTLCNVPYEITVRLVGALPWHLKFTFTQALPFLYNLSLDIVGRRPKSCIQYNYH